MLLKDFLQYRIIRLYLRLLAVLYTFGGTLHILDLFNLRLNFWRMSTTRKAWIAYLATADLAAAFGLWRNRYWGVILFLIISSSQLVAYIGFSGIFGDQEFLIVFHVITIGLYVILSVVSFGCRARLRASDMSQRMTGNRET